jgi:hypothetical protein
MEVLAAAVRRVLLPAYSVLHLPAVDINWQRMNPSVYLLALLLVSLQYEVVPCNLSALPLQPPTPLRVGEAWSMLSASSGIPPQVLFLAALAIDLGLIRNLARSLCRRSW